MNNRSEMTMIIFAIGILFILFIPIPAKLLDFLLIVNFSWALTILLLTFFTDKPLSFSTFPALLLISTLFRLALNISATRLILSEAYAGQVIDTIGRYVIHGNYVMGLVVFLILIIVQFIVVTNGSQRVAEVAARFTLDSMPGKQMSIDADLNMGSISQTEAKIRRSQIEKEANFYGAMDGANKFVKGDAIAGILIMLVDIVGGFAIGLIQKGFSLTQSVETYTLLTVGDGLVTQIPALIISTATGIIVTRAATDAHLGSEVARQISAYPKSLIIVCSALFLLLFLKGIPFIPVLIILSGLIFKLISSSKSEALTDKIREDNLYDKIRIKPIEINLNTNLFYELQKNETELFVLIQQIREKIAFDLGFVLPEVSLRLDLKLEEASYQICIQGQSSKTNPLYLDKVLAIASARTHVPKNHHVLNGEEVRDPTYGLPAIWIDRHAKQSAINSEYTVCEPFTVLSTHLNELVHTNLCNLLSREETEKLLLQPAIKTLSEELIPASLSLSQVQRILQNLLLEKVSIRYMNQIIETLLEHAKQVSDIVQLTELVRVNLASSICEKLLSSQNSLHVLTFESGLEQKLHNSLGDSNVLILEPNFTERLIKSIAQHIEYMLAERKRPILLCSTILRRHVKQLTIRVMPHLTVLAMNEIPINIQVESFGIVK